MNDVETAVYQAIIGELEQIERTQIGDDRPINACEVAQRLASLVALSGRLEVVERRVEVARR